MGKYKLPNKDQLLNVTVIVGFIAPTEDEVNSVYPAAFTYTLDVEGQKFEEFVEGLKELPGVVLTAKPMGWEPA